MLSLFKANPIKKLKKAHDQKLEEAFLAQRRGDIQGYSQLTYEAEQIHKQIQEFKAQKPS